jgi:hypothetical protein
MNRINSYGNVLAIKRNLNMTCLARGKVTRFECERLAEVVLIVNNESGYVATLVEDTYGQVARPIVFDNCTVGQLYAKYFTTSSEIVLLATLNVVKLIFFTVLFDKKLIFAFNNQCLLAFSVWIHI